MRISKVIVFNFHEKNTAKIKNITFLNSLKLHINKRDLTSLFNISASTNNDKCTLR